MKKLSLNISISILRYNIDICIMPFGTWQFLVLSGMWYIGPIQLYTDKALYYEILNISVGIDF